MISHKIRSTFILLFISLAFSFSFDSWKWPEVRDYYSADSTFMVRVIPANIPEYLYHRPGCKRKLNQLEKEDTTYIPSQAQLFQITESADTLLVWKEKLINYVAPRKVIISNDGRYMVTIDNWASLGGGLDVFVVYDGKTGMLLNRYALDDFSPFPINQYMMTISSIWWSCDNYFEENNRINICAQNENEERKWVQYNPQDSSFKAINPESVEAQFKN